MVYQINKQIGECHREEGLAVKHLIVYPLQGIIYASCKEGQRARLFTVQNSKGEVKEYVGGDWRVLEPDEADFVRGVVHKKLSHTGAARVFTSLHEFVS